MKTNNAISLLESYLLSKENDTIQLVGIKEHKSLNLPYTSIFFNYFGIGYEIKVYNSTFMIVRLKGCPGTVCDSIEKAKFEIDKILKSLMEYIND